MVSWQSFCQLLYYRFQGSKWYLGALKIFKAPDMLNLKRNNFNNKLETSTKASSKERKKDIEKKWFKNLLSPNVWYPHFEFAQRFHLRAFSCEERFGRRLSWKHNMLVLPGQPVFWLALGHVPPRQAPRKWGPTSLPPSLRPTAGLLRSKAKIQSWPGPKSSTAMKPNNTIPTTNIPWEFACRAFSQLTLRNLASQKWNPDCLTALSCPNYTCFRDWFWQMHPWACLPGGRHIWRRPFISGENAKCIVFEEGNS